MRVRVVRTCPWCLRGSHRADMRRGYGSFRRAPQASTRGVGGADTPGSPGQRECGSFRPAPLACPRGVGLPRGLRICGSQRADVRCASAARVCCSCDKPSWLQVRPHCQPAPRSISFLVFFDLSSFSISSKCSHTLDSLLLVIGKFHWHVVPPFGELVVDDLFSRRRISN